LAHAVNETVCKGAQDMQTSETGTCCTWATTLIPLLD